MSKMFFCVNCKESVLVTDRNIVKVKVGKMRLITGTCPKCGNPGLIRHG